MRHPAALLVLCGLALSGVGRGDSADPFPFVLPWDDASLTAVSVSALSPAPLDASRRIAVRGGHFVDATGRRVRFVGTNFAAGACFPEKDDAVRVAGHLRKLGFNCVRLHHMDSAWAEPNLFAFRGGSAGLRTDRLDAQSLDRLDYLVYQLKRHGIYVDINLHVGRGFNRLDGFRETERLNDMGKVAGYFVPGMIARQRLFARQLLTHRNPYTKLRYSEDPVVALVEITNEDSVLDAAGSLPALPEPYRGLLRRGWNRFLRARHGTTERLLSAWNAGVRPLGPNLLQNPQFLRSAAGWVLETHQGTTAQLTAEPIGPAPGAPTGSALHLHRLGLDGVGWHLQLHQLGLDLQEGETYTVSFAARAGQPRPLALNARWDDPDWSGLGLDARVELTPDWRRHTFTFIAGPVHANHNRLSFTFGDDATEFWIADISLQTGGGAVTLAPDETLEAGTLPLPTLSDSRLGRSYAAYLMEVENRFSQTMYRYLKRELRVRSPVACTQASYSGIAGAWRESKLDWIDMHAYWQHPWFPNRPWDANDFRIGNTPLVREAGGGTLAELARYRVAGKPFTVSEYDHPAPSEYAAEMVPLIFAYAAHQDWDGVFLFAYQGDDTNWNRDHIEGFFDQEAHPGKLAFLPSAASLFLRGYLPAAAGSQTLGVPVGQLPALLAQGAGGEAWRRARAPQGLDFVGLRSALRFTPGGALEVRRTGATVTGPPPLAWHRGDSQARFTVDTPCYQSVVGALGDLPVSLRGLTVRAEPTPRGFASFTLVSLDGKPLSRARSALLTLLDKAENPGLVWSPDRDFAAHAWEQGPTQIWGVTAELTLARPAGRAVVYALDGTGRRIAQVPSTQEGGLLRFTASPLHRTIWYEITETSQGPRRARRR